MKDKKESPVEFLRDRVRKLLPKHKDEIKECLSSFNATSVGNLDRSYWMEFFSFLNKLERGDSYSLNGLSSQARAFIEYKLGREDWSKQLEGGDYIVCLSDYSRRVKKNHVYKVYRGAADCGGMFIVLREEGMALEWNSKCHFRPACSYEIAEYEQFSYQSDTTAHTSKDNTSVGLSDSLSENGNDIGSLIMDNQWGEIVEELKRDPVGWSPNMSWDPYKKETEGSHGFNEDLLDRRIWEISGSTIPASSRPSVIPLKEDKHIEINILKRNINI